MLDSRVAVTGVGVVSSAGIGAEPFWETLTAGRQSVKTIDLFDASGFACSVAGQLDDFSARKFVPKDYRKAVKVMARDIEIAVAAAELAFRDAGIVTPGSDSENATVDPKRLGCNIGAGLICSDLTELGTAVNTAVVDGKLDLQAWGRDGINNLTPLWLLKYLPNMLSCHVTIIHKAEGPSNCITCGACSAHLAAAESARIIERGAAEVVIAGGAESKLNPMGLLRQELLKRLTTSRDGAPPPAARPFDASHDGTVLGEGGGLLVLENMDRAIARGAEIYAELVGFAGACDPAGINVGRRNAGSLDVAVRKAIAQAGIVPEQIDLIVAHGTGVADEDAAECQAWQRAMGDAVADTPAFAITGSIGSLFAGAGGCELAAAMMALKTQTVAPTVNHTSTGDGCTLNLSTQARSAEIDYVVSGAFSIGGQSGACVFKRYEG